MEGRWQDGVVIVGGDARQRLYDARGYGRPLDGNEVALSPVEAAYLLARGDLGTVDGQGFQPYVESNADAFGPQYLVYADLRSRGFYVAPDRAEWVDAATKDADLVVYARGAGRGGEIAHRVQVIGERTSIPAGELGTAVLAVTDEEGEITYFDTDRPEPTGASATDPPAVSGSLLADRVVCWDPPEALYGRYFYGQPLGEDETGPIQLSLIEAAAMARRDRLTVASGTQAILDRGREVEGDRFDHRLTVYETLRDRGVVPKTGFKFGADFRTYNAVDSVDDLGHSEALVRVMPRLTTVTPRQLSLYVRLAGGVRKRLLLALVDGDDVAWREIGRLTP